MNHNACMRIVVDSRQTSAQVWIHTCRRPGAREIVTTRHTWRHTCSTKLQSCSCSMTTMYTHDARFVQELFSFGTQLLPCETATCLLPLALQWWPCSLALLHSFLPPCAWCTDTLSDLSMIWVDKLEKLVVLREALSILWSAIIGGRPQACDVSGWQRPHCPYISR